MRVVLQRVTEASVRVNGEIVGAIGPGLALLIGVARTDTNTDVAFVIDKCVNLRIFADENGKMNRSLLDTGGAVLAISQFTLYGDTRKGRRPGFDLAAPSDTAEQLYDQAVERLKSHGLTVATGRFGTDMKVSLVNDGPVTFIVESP
ncbi:MAG: D-tyrosyl-tRNA(Tyr) deacylase [candidate division Zixibacteria bacterium]|nr:D-tyrosyl-tRNA(Tyr) deacylase [candidate division Zixibacteria bacterium]